jgi:hypothetical protein
MANDWLEARLRLKDGQKLRPGEYFVRCTGPAIRIERVSRMSNQGANGSRTHVVDVRIHGPAVRRSAIPEGAIVHQPAPRVARKNTASDEPKTTPKTADEAAYRLGLRRIAAMASELQRERIVSLLEEDGDPVPLAQRQPVVEASGRKFRNALAARSEWRDPEDTNPNRRVPKMARGHRRYDPIMHLLRSGSVTQEHALAADRYRLAWELGPGGAMPGYERSEAGSQQYGPSSGPTAERANGERRWQEVQSLFTVPKQRACLEAIVLQRTEVYRWAKTANMSKIHAVGYLQGLLDILWEHYKDEISEHIRRSGPPI